MNYQETAKGILGQVGGIENISFMTNCATRLRLNFKDESKVDLEAVKKTPGVVGAVKKGGQYQIIIGTDVGHVLSEIQKCGTITGGEAGQEKKENLVGDMVSQGTTPRRITDLYGEGGSDAFDVLRRGEQGVADVLHS